MFPLHIVGAIMTRLGNLLTATFLATLAGPVTAQSSGIPAEFPPLSYTANQYVDSEGCAFIRAGISGIVNWVPRVDRTRTQLCNFQPTFAVTAPVADPVMTPEPMIETAMAEAPAAAPATTPAPSRNVGAPIETVASIGAERAALPIVAAPAPASVPAAAPAPAPRVAPTPAPITFAEACEGRSGLQAGFVSNVTGEAIDCGPGDQVASVVEPLQPRRMTLADACAEMAASGSVLIDSATSRPIACPATQMIAAAPTPSIALPTAPSAPATASAPAAPSSAQVAQVCGGQIVQMRTPEGMEVRCVPQTQLPYTTVPTVEPTVTSRAKTPSFGDLFRETPVPASNPTVAAGTTVKRPAGYENVWDDGRLNANRGLPKPTPAASGHHFVQVGTFGDHSNANRLGQRLAGLGLPVGIVNRGQMKMVVSGPFNDPAALQRALATVRGMGFSDAYTRN